MSSSAVFDVLFLVQATWDSGGLTPSELHTLDYLACLISVYDGRAPLDWEHGYSVTDLGSPHSAVVQEAGDRCVRAGWIDRGQRVLTITELGQSELKFQKLLPPTEWRLRYLGAAVSASVTMTLPSIVDALNHEPGLRRAMRFLRRQRLLDEASVDLLEAQFDDLRAAIGVDFARPTLVVPTAVWLSFLASKPRFEN